MRLSTVILKRDHSGGYYLVLVAANGEPLATSESYRTHWGAKRAARHNFPGHPLNDLTLR